MGTYISQKAWGCHLVVAMSCVLRVKHSLVKSVNELKEREKVVCNISAKVIVAAHWSV